VAVSTDWALRLSLMFEALPNSSTNFVVISAKAFLGGTMMVILLVPSLEISDKIVPLSMCQQLDQSLDPELLDGDLALILRLIFLIH
jgi:hypothetical protein